MTPTLEQAMAEIARLPADEQERIVKWLLDELGSEREWQKKLTGSQGALSELAQEARADVAAGKDARLCREKP